MNTSVLERAASACEVTFTKDSLVLVLTDGRRLSVPLSWYPRLLHGTRAERAHTAWIGGGLGIHWPDLDEDISVAGLLAGEPSRERPESLRAWLAARQRNRHPADEVHEGREAYRTKRRKR